jgi:hypothetical protein
VVLENVYLRVLLFSPVSIIPPTLHTHLHLHVALTGGTNGRSLGTLQKAKLFRAVGGRWIGSAFCVYKLTVSVHSEGTATGQLDQGAPWLSSVLQQMLNRYPKSTLHIMHLTRHSVVTLPSIHTQFSPATRPLPSTLHSSSSIPNFFPSSLHEALYCV